MGLKFKLIPSKFFLGQIKILSIKEKKLISNKLKLIKENPFRFKPLKGFKHLFEIKITISNSYSRLIYAAFFPNENSIRIFGIFQRDNDFKDFYKQFKLEIKKIRK